MKTNMKQIVCVVFILTLRSVCTVESDSCEPFELKSKLLNKQLVGHSVAERNGYDLNECVKLCMSLSVCESTDYFVRNKTCKLNDVDTSSVDMSEFRPLNGAIFSDISDWPNVMVASCGSRPCAKHQRCIHNKESFFCIDMRCPNPAIANGKLLLSTPGNNKFLDTGKVQCRKGYIANQPSVKCEASGQWEKATCVPEQTETVCEIPSIANGELVLSAPDNNKFLDTATVQCRIGYMPDQPSVKCEASGQWEKATCVPVTDCQDITQINPDSVSGVYDILLWKSKEVLSVYCDMDTAGGSWTVFQRRFNGSTNFYRKYSEYTNGFGSVDEEFWLGLKYIQEIAEQDRTELRIDVSSEDGKEGYEMFQDFSLKGQEYNLTLGNRNSSLNIEQARYGMFYNKGMGFSTNDHDVDNTIDRNCAILRQGAWWFNSCFYVHLNGRYCTPGTTCINDYKQSTGISHYGFAKKVSLKTSTMMIRRINT